MADIKKFTGFIAPDGSLHDTAAKASAYTKELKAKEALKELFAGMEFPEERFPEIYQDDRGNEVIAFPDLRPMLERIVFENRAAIVKAFEQNVKLRDRKPNKKKAAVTIETIAEAA